MPVITDSEKPIESPFSPRALNDLATRNFSAFCQGMSTASAKRSEYDSKASVPVAKWAAFRDKHGHTIR